MPGEVRLTTKLDLELIGHDVSRKGSTQVNFGSTKSLSQKMRIIDMGVNLAIEINNKGSVLDAATKETNLKMAADNYEIPEATFSKITEAEENKSFHFSFGKPQTQRDGEVIDFLRVDIKPWTYWGITENTYLNIENNVDLRKVARDMYPQCIENIDGYLREIDIKDKKDLAEIIKETEESDQAFFKEIGFYAYMPHSERYITRGCLYYDNSNVIKRPNTESIKAISRNRNVIKRIAKKIDVNATAIACSIGADATLTKNAWLSYKDARLNSLENPLIKFSSEEMDDLISDIEEDLNLGRDVVTKLKSNFYSEESTIIKTAVILKQAELIYSESNIDISERPEILATLYNIGIHNSAVQKAIDDKKDLPTTYSPKPNFFGVYCQKFQNEYENALK
jgi:hypothetical protein